MTASSIPEKGSECQAGMTCVAPVLFREIEIKIDWVLTNRRKKALYSHLLDVTLLLKYFLGNMLEWGMSSSVSRLVPSWLSIRCGITQISTAIKLCDDASVAKDVHHRVVEN